MDRISTGLSGLDRVIDGLRLGDNVVWQVDSIDVYREIVQAYVERSLADGRRMVYVRFGSHPPLLDLADERLIVHEVDPSDGFELFATTVHQLVEAEGYFTFYVFDCLTDLLDVWYSDLTVMNFFKVSCPFLYELDTIAYFAMLRGRHTSTMIAGIRETTQLLFDVNRIDDDTYVHPLKVWGRHSPTMFFPHRLEDGEALPVTSSTVTARLFSQLGGQTEPPDPWQSVVAEARRALTGSPEEAERARELLLGVFVGRESRMVELARRWLTLPDLLGIAARQIGTGGIGGKSVGMLVARAILAADPDDRFAPRMEPHDSFYLGSDLFYTYIIFNGWWKRLVRQKTEAGYFSEAAQLRHLLLEGHFTPGIRQRFLEMLEYFGQSPIIVRSSSLLEDNFGNAFAGKYESVFCPNQGSPEERVRALEAAIRRVYASSMGEDALTYRRARGLNDRDEQMAILVQRVSGDYHGELFFPHAAGVGNSFNLYVWDADVDPDAGMLRLVVGLGTRAVDRIAGDYPRIVALGSPTNRGALDDGRSQRYVDALALTTGDEVTQPYAAIRSLDIKTDWGLFASPDRIALRMLAERGRRAPSPPPEVIDFAGLLGTDFPRYMADAMAALEAAYDYPVDIEFTVNLTSADPDSFWVGFVQCRPLQTRGLGPAVAMPDADDADALFASTGDFMGGNVRVPLSHVVMVRPEAYLALGTQDRHEVARQLGALNQALAGESFALLGPGRWGTTTPSLGVPVGFAEISNAAALVEFTYADGDFLPELSHGSHFFGDLVETGIFYVALFEDRPGVTFHPELLLARENLLAELAPAAARLADVLHVARTDGLVLYSDVPSQRVVCR